MDSIEKSLESKSQSISDWWNCVPSLDKEGLSGTLLVRLEDAIKEVKDLEVELKRVGKLYNSALLSVPVLTDLEIEVRVREEMINKFKSFLKKHEVMFFGCDCSDCQTMENMTMKEKFKEKYFSCFIQDCKNKPFGFFGVGKTKGLIEDGKILICYCKKHKKEAEKLAKTEKKRLNAV